MRRRQTPPAPARWGAPLLALAAALAMIAGGPAPAARGQERVAVPYALPTPGPCLERDKDGAPILPDRYWYCPAPLSTNAITVVSWHFCNSSSLPMRINPKSFSQPSVDDLSIDLPPPPWEMRDTDTPQDCLSQFPWARLAIGGENSDGFYPDIDRVVWSHFIPESVPPYTFFGHHRAYITCSFSYRFCWRKRAGIELLPGEGYMRRVTFFPGWELNPRRPTFPFHWNPGRQPLIRHPDWDETFDDGWHNPADVVVPGV
ncbi:MAG: hypothetical protein J6333_00255, partial [Planctomycetes bacterium]|nr:hypothetical protein [Planctomycetota bacterium]